MKRGGICTFHREKKCPFFLIVASSTTFRVEKKNIFKSPIFIFIYFSSYSFDYLARLALNGVYTAQAKAGMKGKGRKAPSLPSEAMGYSGIPARKAIFEVEVGITI